jgi:hypothetical protein
MKPLLESRCLYPQGNGTALKNSSLARRLRTLANHRFIVGEAKRADVIWSEGDFLALCEHMLNDNQPNHFLTAWVDQGSGHARFAKAPMRCRADKRASWAWATITGKAKAKTAIGFYPSNPEKKSRWAAIDFDAHSGEHERARKWSREAFSWLVQHPQLYLILCASGNGYHLFICTRELYPVGQWIVLLKQVCKGIGAPILEGTCEIFPNERAELQPTGKGIRAPGTWNPKNNTFSLIKAETVTPLLETLPRRWTLGVGKVARALPRNNAALSLHKSTNTYFLTTHSGSTEPIVEALLARYEIKEKGTRNSVLMRMIGDLAHKFGYGAAQRIVEEHYRRNQENVRSPLDEHLREFETAWDGMHKKLVDSLSPEERQKFNGLGSEHQREGFLIVRAFAGTAAHNGEKDFAIARASLADRLSITPPGAADVIRKLCELKAIAQTQDHVRHKKPARFCWLLPLLSRVWGPRARRLPPPWGRPLPHRPLSQWQQRTINPLFYLGKHRLVATMLPLLRQHCYTVSPYQGAIILQPLLPTPA